ncbi:MAG: hypothetical protein H6684_16235, partial [Deltaproteobacteria bacterium]|nr:hypothetical protein [Deltaproteobacteria bacterium]MCB9490281.1 hypothetical protein [Deltaproteobacteria bacterium]
MKFDWRMAAAMGAILILAMGAACSGDGDSVESRDELSGESDAIDECIRICEVAMVFDDTESGDPLDLSSGPCLSEEIIDDYACDIRHDPRTDEDDLETNQCDDFQDGVVPHQVEVDENCELLGVV